MSGGNYNYLFINDSSDLLSGQHDTDLQSMADRLAELGYASDAAIETQQLLLAIRQSRNRLEASRKRLESLWRAVEWWDSGDSSEEEVKTALKK